MKYAKKRAFLKLLSIAAAIPLIEKLDAAINEKKTTTILLLDARNDSGNIIFQNELQTEFFKASHPNERLNIINIDISTQNDPIKLKEAIKGFEIAAYITVGKRATLAALTQINTIPVIFNTTEDPFTNGILNSSQFTLRSVTGFTSYLQTNVKRWEILKEAFPRIKKIIVFADKNWHHLSELKKESIAVANALGKIDVVEINIGSDIVEQMKSTLSQKQIGLDIPHTSITSINPRTVIERINQSGLPAIYDGAHYVKWGGLFGYEAVPLNAAKTTLELLSLITNGLNAKKIPIRYPTTFTFAINLKTANQHGMTIKKSLILRADSVITS